MAYYERLSALDASFIGLEDTRCHMHVGGVFIFDAEPIKTESGGIDIERIRRGIHSRLHLVPRFRQKLAYLPYEGWPIWIDDDRFRLHYHVRHSALPRPGDERTLKRMVGRIQSQQLDRSRPLWEMWFVEGLEGNRFALITKTHHCMIDGISGADLMSVIMELDPDTPQSQPIPWVPRPAPSESTLIAHEVRRRIRQPFEVLGAVRDGLRHPEATLRNAEETLSAVMETLTPALNPASATPLNVDVGPSRRFDWTEMRIADLKAIKNELGGTLNDVVLAIVAGALRLFFRERGLDPDELRVRAMVPVSVRSADERGALGNRIAEMVADLPVHLDDPVERLRVVRETMADLKESRQAVGAEVLTAIAEWTVPNVLVQAVRMAERSRPYNLVVTNVPGPQIPLYLQGCEMLTSYPVVPIFRNQALVVGLFSYNGGLFWGLNADWETVPDLHDFIDFIERSHAELARRAAPRKRKAAAARKKAAPGKKPATGKKRAARKKPAERRATRKRG
jgi:WS/DGAT/MGAT family acyltransferase